MSLLDVLARRWRRRWLLSVALVAGATTALVAALANWMRLSPPIGIGAAAGVGIAIAMLLRQRRVDPLTIARHLNRVVPALEESTDLLAGSPDSLSPVQRMQRSRVEQSLAALSPEPRLPYRTLGLAAGFAAAALLIALGLLAISPPDTASRVHGAGSPAARRAMGPPAPTDVSVTIRPPAYTSRPARQTRDWDLDAEQGARITWRLRTNRPVDAALLVTSDGDSVLGRPLGDREFELSTEVEHPLLYQLVLHDGATTVASDYHRLGVIPDAPPTLTVVRPEPRTQIAFGSPQVVQLEVLAADDYHLTDVRIVATLTTGAGEAVKFREQVLEFDATNQRPGTQSAVMLRKTLNPAALAMQPGDELYFYVLAHDNRAPQPNETRTETFFISLADTAHVLVADLSGLAVNVLPEYLRSQRQVIIDTEELLAQAASLAPATVHDRSNNIGLDQHLLRERYGEILGQEEVVAGTEPTIEHEHDTPESATLLAQSVKDTLRAAVAQMWDAELRLRTYQPSAALPYEYRALELLKQVQQAARLYVQRVGFEPPPLEPDRKRLTGTLTAIGNPTRHGDVAPPHPLEAVRAALAVVQRLHTGGRRQAGDAALLERAGRLVAQLAINQPGAHLQTLRDLRTLIGTLEAPGPGCADCVLRVERGLWRALPAPDPELGNRDPAQGLARDYFDRLHRAGP